MPTFNKVDMLDCAAGHHDFSDDASECRVCGHTHDRASVPANHVRDASHDLLAALKAIVARINGEWDLPELMAVGPLGMTDDDILRIARAAIAKAEGAV